MISGNIDLAPDYAGKTICGLVRDTARTHPDKLVMELDGDAITYGQLYDDAEAIARALHARGMTMGAHIGIMLPNSIDYLRLYIGILVAGGVPVTLNSRYRGDELIYALNHAEIQILFLSASPETDFLSMLAQNVSDLNVQGTAQDSAELTYLRHLVVVENAPRAELSLSAFTAEQVAVDFPTINDEDYAVMMFTSGTTAAPKACLVTHRSLIGNGINMVERWLMNEDDKFYNPLPFFHMSVLLPLVGCILSRTELYATRHFKAEKALEVFKRVPITIGFFAFPTITNEIIYHPQFDQEDVKTFRIINNVAPISTLLQYEKAFPSATGVSAYGLTECGGVSCFSNPREPMEKRLPTVGEPFPGVEIRIADAEDPMKILGPNEKGEIQIHGYNLFSGYYKDEEATRNTMTSDGWLRTGDLGHLDDDGYLYFVGRLKDMLKVGGENVAAAEIESLLDTHPAVEMSQIVAAPDDRLQEVAAAYIRLHQGASATEEELIEFCRGKVASYKVPRYVRFVEEWPMSGTKVQKFELRTRISEELKGKA
jgi:fatty-acyl-CoA synthase